MRIISGQHKRRRLLAPKNLPVRPTTDRAKEALFNILQHEFDFENIRVLDLFAGTGSISYEFASRGVPQILAVDQNRHCIQFIETTKKKLNLTIETFCSSVEKFLERFSIPQTIVFMDPPYSYTEESYSILIDHLLVNCLEDQGWIIAEHDTHHKFDSHPNFIQKRKYGSCQFSIFKKK